MSQEQIKHPTRKYKTQKSDANKKLFLEKYRECGTRLVACRAVNISRKSVYDWEKNDPEFAAAMREAEKEVVEILENTALQRATSGGSDQLLMFLLKALDGNKYSERIRHEFTSKTLESVVTEVLDAIRKNVPDFCPHCRTALDIAPAVAKDLMDMSERLSGRKEVAP
jgi:AcrR family transcriptional regulator